MRFILIALLALAGCSDDDLDADGGVNPAAGKAFADRRQCPMCHQADDGTLSGQTKALPGTMAFGSNLTPDRDTGLGGWADEEIVRAMRFGFDNQNQPLCPPMTHLKDPKDPTSITGFDDMGDVEALAIVSYLRSLEPVSRQIPDSMCPPLKPTPPVDMAVPQLDLSMPMMPPTDDLSTSD